jgi:hypothetical protein
LRGLLIKKIRGHLKNETRAAARLFFYAALTGFMATGSLMKAKKLFFFNNKLMRHV